MQVYKGNGTNAQKFKIVKVQEIVGKQTIPNGTYKIKTITNGNIGIEVEGLTRKQWSKCAIRHTI